MTLLRRNRRNRRARAPKKRKRRNLDKFIPSADSDFALTADEFAGYLTTDPVEHNISADEAAEIAKVVGEFRAALAVAIRRRTRTIESVDAKDRARRKAEEIVRRFGRIIRADPLVESWRKKLLRIKEPAKKLKPRKYPQGPPVLQFIGTGDGVAMESGPGGGSGVHVLKVWHVDALDNLQKKKPDGAERIEVFFDLVPPGEPIPRHPAERGWPKFLCSRTGHKIEVEYPVPISGPMLVVYWVRWANATGGVGKFSKTCVARVEGWTANPAQLAQGAEGSAPRLEGRAVETKYIFIHTPIAGELPEASGREGEGLANELSALGQRCWKRRRFIDCPSPLCERP